jgi:hypothetical protein
MIWARQHGTLNSKSKFMLPGWHRVFTVNGEFLGLHNWDSGNGYLVLSQDSSRKVYQQHWHMLSSV